MGVYLSEPVKEKHSSDGTCDKLTYGASSMQGWRISQEDAHNCIINYDKDTSFFAVYDGHGGAEVAQYCSQHLPGFIREMPHYKEGDLEKALENGFLEFDLTLKKPEVIAILKEMAGITEGSASEDENEAAALQEEADMPLEDILARYQSSESAHKWPYCRHVHDDKPRSPYLRAKKCHANGNEEDLEEPCSSKDETVVTATQGSKLLIKEDSPKKELDSETSLNGTSEKIANDETKASTSPGKKEDINNKVETPQEGASSPVASSHSNSSAKCAESSNSSEPFVEKAGSSKQHDYGSKLATGGECSSSNLRRNHILKSRLMKRDKLDLSSDECDSSDEEDYGKDEEDEDEEEEDSDDEEEEEEEEESDEDDETDECVSYKEMPGRDSGCTAVVAVLRGGKLYVANAGDSRCVVSREGTAVEMSFDHKPEDEPERARIVKAGGEVSAEGRVNGGLNLSRAIGDHSYKENTELPPQEQMITALPDIKTLDIDPKKEEFMVLACDGIWNSMTSQEVVDFVHTRIKKQEYTKLSSICEELFDHCLAPNTLGDGSGCDNMTCIIVKFHDPELPKNSKRPFSEVDDIAEIVSTKKIRGESEEPVTKPVQSDSKTEISVDKLNTPDT